MYANSIHRETGEEYLSPVSNSLLIVQSAEIHGRTTKIDFWEIGSYFGKFCQSLLFFCLDIVNSAFQNSIWKL